MEGKDLTRSFVSESELAEVKKKRQEEWEKNRKPGQPMERPEDKVDNRSLFERLQSQKRENDLKYEEDHKFSNQIQRLDEEDAEFLSLVTHHQSEAIRQKQKEENDLMQELKEHRTRQAASSSSKLKLNLPTMKIVPGSAKRKRSLDDEKDLKKSKISDSLSSIKSSSSEALTNHDQDVDLSANNTVPSAEIVEKDDQSEERSCSPSKVAANQGTQKSGTIEVLGFLPGIGPYSSSDSESDDEGSLMKCFTKRHFTQKQMMKIMRKGS